MKPIKLPRMNKTRGLYSFFDGDNYRYFTNRRKYINELTRFEKELNHKLNVIVTRQVTSVYVLRDAEKELQDLSNYFQRLSLIYRFSKRGGINDGQRIASMILTDYSEKIDGIKKGGS